MGIDLLGLFIVRELQSSQGTKILKLLAWVIWWLVAENCGCRPSVGHARKTTKSQISCFSALRTVDCGLRTEDWRLPTVDWLCRPSVGHARKTTKSQISCFSALRTVDCGLWTAYCGLRT